MYTEGTSEGRAAEIGRVADGTPQRSRGRDPSLMFGYDDLSREALEAQLFEARLALLESDAAGGDLQARLQALGCFGSWVWLPESNQLWWSAALYRLRDVEPTGMLTFEAYRALVHPDDRARVSAELSHALSTRKIGRAHV